jgi:hypothetical protein
MGYIPIYHTVEWDGIAMAVWDVPFDVSEMEITHSSAETCKVDIYRCVYTYTY